MISPSALPAIFKRLKDKYIAYARDDIWPRTRDFVRGIVEDFWKDGNDEAANKAPMTRRSYAAVLAETDALSRWHAEPGEIEEKMWGAGFVLPLSENIGNALIEPLKLVKDMNVLDLTAGLGTLPQLMADKYGANVTALEPDARIAAHGHAATGYDPQNFSRTDQYDAIVSRELFYRVAGKEKFFAALGACAKPKAQLSFTDFVVNSEDMSKPGIGAWRAYEGAVPLGLVGMAEVWAKAGFTLNFHEDRTEPYRKEVLHGLKRLAIALAGGLKPDAETKRTLMQGLQLWTLRLGAIEQGLRFYRFYGLKQ